MPPIRCWQIDAFHSRPFSGNPAAVCWLEQPAEAAWMQSVAAEMNLAETAFVRRLEQGYELRWFTPEVEVDLCGHATLATSHALWTSGICDASTPLEFQTRSGLLTSRKIGDWIELNFPAMPVFDTAAPADLLPSLGLESARFVGRSQRDYFVEVESAETVRKLRPDYVRLRGINVVGTIVTARSDDPQYDFVSRFFAPSVGINEDPVCGSAHCSLAPYWSAKTGKLKLFAHQVSAREGILRLQVQGDRIVLGGQAVTVWEGKLLC